MAFDITVAEVAERLQVSKPRAYQLVSSGVLSAKKVGGTWLVDGSSVDAYLTEKKSRAKTFARKTQRSVQLYELMNRSHQVCTFRYDSDQKEFISVDEILDVTRAPLGLVSSRGTKISKSSLEYWWKHRSIPRTRIDIRKRILELGYVETFQIPFKSLGLSLSDQYWIRPSGSDIRWDDVNFFDNDFDDMRLGSAWDSGVGLISPDNTSEGELPKKWFCDGKKRLLAKGGSVLNQEPYNEVIATALYARLLEEGEYLPYWLQESPLGTVCVCENFVSSDEEYIPAYYICQLMRKANHHSDYQHYLECCAEVGVYDIEQSLAKMIACDDILGNFDRHWRNFGLIRNVETMEYRVAPLFDGGNSLWCTVSLEQLRAHNYAFSTKPFYEEANRQLRLVQDYSWFDPDALIGFVDEVSSVLSKNEAVASRVDFICSAVQERIDRIVRML